MRHQVNRSKQPATLCLITCSLTGRRAGRRCCLPWHVDDRKYIYTCLYCVLAGRLLLPPLAQLPSGHHLPHLVKILISVLGTKCFSYKFRIRFGALIKRFVLLCSCNCKLHIVHNCCLLYGCCSNCPLQPKSRQHLAFKELKLMFIYKSLSFLLSFQH